ncbi:MAG: Cytochrome c oxidase subunit CcoN (EC, partial [uncultured Thiotrichaceae bacterium]
MAHGAVASSEQYNYEIVKKFTIAAIIWGLAGMTAGVYIASELAWPFLNFDIAQITFGRLRPVHTSGVIFGFGGNALFATSYYIVQRTCQVRLWGGKLLPEFTFWGWNLSLIVAGIGYMYGITQAREYAEPEWYVDIAITVVWVAYFLVFTMTLVRRTQPHIYVANWFFMSFILATALLH